jgi:ABC-type lipoprotein release transport system permease subunit
MVFSTTMLDVLGTAALALLLYGTLPYVKRVPLSYNLRNLQVRWLTTLVTGLAFTSVIGLLVVMLAFVQGMAAMAEASGDPRNVIILSDGAIDESISNLPRTASVQALPQNVQKMIARDGEQGQDYLAVKEVYVIVNYFLPNQEPGGQKRRFVQMRGIDKPQLAARIHGVQLAQGEWFSPSGVRSLSPTETAYEVVLGDGIAKMFGKDRGVESVGPGEVLRIGQLKWYVVGVLDSSGSMFGSEIWALDTHVGPNFGRKDSYTSYVVRVNDPSQAAEMSKELKEFREFSLMATPERQYYARLGEANQTFLIAITFVAAIMAIGGVLGVMNTMFAAISQRRKDIGVLRLMGFTRGQVLTSFLMESLVIAFLGGALGCAAAYLLFDGLTASSIMAGQGGGGKSVVLRITVNGWIIADGMALTFLMGLIGGLIPALSAMRLRPLESLK